VGQKGVLLRAIEAVNFIDEEDRPRAVSAGLLSFRHDRFDLFDSGENRAERNKL